MPKPKQQGPAERGDKAGSQHGWYGADQHAQHEPEWPAEQPSAAGKR
jgi:hypothetical protein